MCWLAHQLKGIQGVVSIFLIGSIVSGPVDYDSDIDLVLVVATSELVEPVRKQIHSQSWSKFPLDLIVVAKSELEVPSEGSGLVAEIKGAGVRLL